jgi:hypothetical protein
MEFILIIGTFCIVPLLLISFGYWLGLGAPGWPWAVVKRDSPGRSQQTPYYDEEAYQR